MFSPGLRLTCLWLHFLTLLISTFAHTVCHDKAFVPDVVLRVSTHNVATSCLPPKLTILINGSSPAPELRLREGKKYWIRVYNDMEDHNTTMHWHGLTAALSPWADGTPSLAQWPIPPLHFFDYEIDIPLGMAGTYFYHSHVDLQAASAAGPLIIEDIKVPYHYDEEKIIFVSDVFKKTDDEIIRGLLGDPFEWSGESAMILVNGQGGGTANGTACNASLSTINVRPGKTYRLRFIVGTALTFASFAIEGHDTLTVIEADGQYTKPSNTSFLQLGSGQRYSVLLKTKARPEKKTYYMQLESRERPVVVQSFAVLNYGNRTSSKFYPPSKPPLTLPLTSEDHLEYVLAPLHPNDFPAACEVTRRVFIDVQQVKTGGKIAWFQNKETWTEAFPKEPYLVSLYKNDQVEFPSMERALSNGGIDPVTRAFPCEIGEVIEIVIQNTANAAGGLDVHPWHGHGGHYYDIGHGNGSYDAEANEKKLQGTHPIKRDTTMLYRYGSEITPNTEQGWRAWRLRVTQPGVWLVHCHTLQHMIMGMQTVWVMGNSTGLFETVPKPDIDGYLTYGGSAVGNESHWPVVTETSNSWATYQK